MHSLSRSDTQTDSKTAICTLFEGDYHFGLAALVNSLVYAGYSGTVWAGYKGELPPWLNQLKRLDEAGDEYLVGGHLRLVFLPLKTELHFTNYKPQFMLDLFAEAARGSEYLWYFDPDIFVRCSWSFFEDWQKHGIALCQEIVNNILPADSPMRYKWIEAVEKEGFGNPKQLHHYYNGGVVGVSPRHVSFLENWRKILKLAETEGYSLKTFMAGNREMPFFGTDQDALNVAAMYTEHPLTTMGPEAMGFLPSGFTMYHAVGPKPWRARFIFRALAGVPPSNADKFFLTHVSSPIRAYSSGRLAGKRVACLIAAFVGRFYRRH